jgi:hypothetical protein
MLLTTLCGLRNILRYSQDILGCMHLGKGWDLAKSQRVVSLGRRFELKTTDGYPTLPLSTLL